MENLEDQFVKLNIEDLLGCIHGKDSDGKDLVVKYPPHNKVKDEFDTFVNKEIADRRKHSTVSTLRSFHNTIVKRMLLVNITNLYKSIHPKEKVNLLDIAVGRGGDMFKWNEAGISNVFGFDKSDTSIHSINPFDQGAKERYQKTKDQLRVNIEYTTGDAINPSVELIRSIGVFLQKHNLINKKQPTLTGFQIISCQFAMHYFFQSELALRNVLGQFSQLLKKGGYFIGTCVNGERITDLLKDKTTFKNSLLEVTKHFKAKVPTKPFGNEYTFSMNDSFDQGNYFNTMGESVEYLVNIPALKRIAHEYNLEPVYTNIYEQYEREPGQFLYTSMPDFVSFDYIYNLNLFRKGKLSPEEQIINNLYTTFVFIKV